MLSSDQIARIVRDVINEMQPPVRAGEACTPPPRPVHNVDHAESNDMLGRLVAQTSSLIAVGHAGARMKTDLYLRLREGHADAKDAVNSSVPEGWAAQHGLLPLATRCRDHHEYLLYPNLGRRLDDASAARLTASPCDVAVILGDGLSPNALLVNGPACLQALQAALKDAGYSSSAPMFVKHARIGVQDQIGVLLKARATVILVGERPGLGTGDSLSFYIAVNPKLDQDNAEKNCISNVRPIGIRPEEAAKLTVEILKRAFEKGVGGVAIGFGYARQ